MISADHHGTFYTTTLDAEHALFYETTADYDRRFAAPAPAAGVASAVQPGCYRIVDGVLHRLMSWPAVRAENQGTGMVVQ